MTFLASPPSSPANTALRGAEARTWDLFSRAYPGFLHGSEAEGDRTFVTVGEGRHRVALEDGVRGKTFEQRLDSPDLVECLEDSYPLELEVDSWPLNLDPGRMRSDPFFRAVYGDSAEAVRRNLAEVDFCGHRVRFNRTNGAADALARVGRRIAALVDGDRTLEPYVETLGGTFAWRTVEGTARLSAHSYGVSIDLNPKIGGYWRWSGGAALGDMRRRRMYPDSIVKAFESEKFIWGGKWYHFDLMHFEYRPEFFG